LLAAVYLLLGLGSSSWLWLVGLLTSPPIGVAEKQAVFCMAGCIPLSSLMPMRLLFDALMLFMAALPPKSLRIAELLFSFYIPMAFDMFGDWTIFGR